MNGKIRAFCNGKMIYKHVFDLNWYETESNTETGCNTFKKFIPEDRNFPTMYSTGLKLKDGTELYEGDKLKYTKHSGYIMEDSILEICWDEEYACFGYKTDTSMFPDMIFAFADHDCLQEDVLNHCELIGNIYQNE